METIQSISVVRLCLKCYIAGTQGSNTAIFFKRRSVPTDTEFNL